MNAKTIMIAALAAVTLAVPAAAIGLDIDDVRLMPWETFGCDGAEVEGGEAIDQFTHSWPDPSRGPDAIVTVHVLCYD